MAVSNPRHPAAETVEDHLRRAERSQAWLGAEVAKLEERGNPYSQAAVSAWLDRIAEQLPARVFLIEQALGMKAGTLSRQLGFLPLDARSTKGVIEAVESDPALDDVGRRAIAALYRELTRR